MFIRNELLLKMTGLSAEFKYSKTDALLILSKELTLNQFKVWAYDCLDDSTLADFLLQVTRGFL